MSIKADKQLVKETVHQLYHLWTKAMDAPNYKKEEWVEIERKINEIASKDKKTG